MENKYPTTEYIKELYKKYLPIYDGERKSGLFLLPAQTGSGKTHATAFVIADVLRNYKDKNIIYLINTKSNRSNIKEDILKLSIDELEKEAFNNDILELKSNEDNLFDFFTNEAFKELRHLNEIDEYIALKKKITSLQEIKKTNVEIYEIYKKEDTDLKNKISQLYKDDEISIELLEEIKKIYPTVGLNNRVIITTSHKFVEQTFTLPTRKYLFEMYDTKNTLIFIDEFDTQKGVILDSFIKKSVEKSLDNFELLKIIHERLHEHLIRDYSKYEELLALKNEIKFFYEENNFANRFKYDSDEKQYFLRDTASITINTSAKKHIIKKGNNLATNFIIQSDEVDYKGSFEELFDKSDKLVNRFLGLIKQSAYEIAATKGEDISDIIYTFLSEFIASKDTQDITIVNRILREQNKKIDKKYFQSDISKAYTGLYSLLTIINDSKHKTTSRFGNYTLENTPEAFLNFLTDKFFVIGISATATIKTKIDNFDLEHLEDKIIYLTKKEIEKLNQLFLEYKVKNRKSVIKFMDNSIHKRKIDIKHYIDSLDLFPKDDNIFDYFWNKLNFEDNNKAYNLSKYIDLLLVYKEFIISETIHKLLYLNTFSFEKKYNLELLYKMIALMIRHNYSNLSSCMQKRFKGVCDWDLNDINLLMVKSSIFMIHFTNANDDKKKWKESLYYDSKVFLVSNFAYMSKGQNIQYDYNDGKIGSITKEKDFDAIYIGEITNRLPSKLDNEKKEHQLLRLLYSLTVLKNNGDISKKEKYVFLKAVLSGSKYAENPYKETEDYINSCMILIIQSIGRLHRTDFPSDIYILFHDTNKKILQRFNPENQSLLPSVIESMLIAKEEISEENASKNHITNETKNKNIKDNLSYILEIFNNKNSSKSKYNEAIEDWEKERVLLLTNPSKEKLYSKDHKYMTMPLKQYWYKQKNDYETIEISHEYKKGYTEVSYEATRLDKLYKIKELQECFSKYNIAKSFEYENILIPIVFNNFYKGAIGEIFGKYILEKYANIKLFELCYESQAQYETFDFTNEDESVYFDFKYFSTYTASSIILPVELADVIKAKLSGENLHNKKVFIINLFDDDTEQSHLTRSSKIEIIDNIYFIPWLINLDKELNPQIDTKMIVKIGEIYAKCANK
ncbi:MAG: DEAD/DEAH box helicase family protein [Arcobacteraceae bacterium]